MTKNSKSDPREYDKPKKPPIDPVVQTLQDIMGTESVTEIYYRSWLSKSTLYNIRTGKTKRPQHMTVAGIARAKGYRIQFVKGR